VAGRNRPVKRGSKGIDKERLIVESMRFNVEQGSAQSARLNQQECESLQFEVETRSTFSLCFKCESADLCSLFASK